MEDFHHVEEEDFIFISEQRQRKSNQSPPGSGKGGKMFQCNTYFMVICCFGSASYVYKVYKNDNPTRSTSGELPPPYLAHSFIPRALCTLSACLMLKSNIISSLPPGIA